MRHKKRWVEDFNENDMFKRFHIQILKIYSKDIEILRTGEIWLI